MAPLRLRTPLHHISVPTQDANRLSSTNKVLHRIPSAAAAISTMQRSDPTDTSFINLDICPSVGFAGDQATAHAHRAAKLISEHLKLNPAAKTRFQEFIQKMLYYKPYKFDDLCTTVVVIRELAPVSHFVNFENTGLAIGAGVCMFNNGLNAQDFPQLLFSGAYSLVENVNSAATINRMNSAEYVSKLALDSRVFTRQEICAMTEQLRGWFDWKLEISSAELDRVKSALEVR